jgi:hypothetical protein
MQVWQRGTTGVAGTATGTYFADRWTVARVVAGSTGTRQTTSDTTNLPNITYCARVARDSGNTATNALFLAQSFESLNSIPLAGKTITLSFYARAGANFSSASSVLNAQIQTGTGTDQNILSGYTGSSTIINQNSTLTTTWQRFTYSATVASTATELGMYFTYTPVGTAGAADYFEVTGVQLEASSVASAYTPNGATYQAELAACQRYYFRTQNTTATVPHTVGFSTTTTAAQAAFPLPVAMRTVPSAVEFSLICVSDNSGYDLAISAITIAQASTTSVGLAITNAATATAFRPCFIKNNNNAAGYLGFTAEL